MIFAEARAASGYGRRNAAILPICPRAMEPRQTRDVGANGASAKHCRSADLTFRAVGAAILFAGLENDFEDPDNDFAGAENRRHGAAKRVCVCEKMGVVWGSVGRRAILVARRLRGFAREAAVLQGRE